jgi:hypothetical protein
MQCESNPTSSTPIYPNAFDQDVFLVLEYYVYGKKEVLGAGYEITFLLLHKQLHTEGESPLLIQCSRVNLFLGLLYLKQVSVIRRCFANIRIFRNLQKYSEILALVILNFVLPSHYSQMDSNLGEKILLALQLKSYEL